MAIETTSRLKDVTYQSVFEAVKTGLEAARREDKILDEAMNALDYYELTPMVERYKEKLVLDQVECLEDMTLDVDWGGNEGIYTDFKEG